MRSMQKLRRELQELIDQQDGLLPILAQIAAASQCAEAHGAIVETCTRWHNLWIQSMAERCRARAALRRVAARR
jgi:hypothetical protein